MTRHCLFCGKADDEVARLFAGPSGHICCECVNLMHDMMTEAEKSGSAAPPAPPDKFFAVNDDGSVHEVLKPAK